MKKLKNQNGVNLIAVIIIVIVVLFFIFIMSSGGSSKYELSNSEGASVAALRYGISLSELDGTGTLSTEYFNTLGELVKNADSNNQWFDDIKTIYYGKTSDTSTQEITYISDGNYVAKFTVEIENPDSFTNKETYLVDYSFEEGTIQGVSISITN